MSDAYYYCHTCDSEITPTYSEHCSTCHQPAELVESTTWKDRVEKAEARVEELESKLKAEREIAQANADAFHDADMLVEELEDTLDFLKPDWRSYSGISRRKKAKTEGGSE